MKLNNIGGYDTIKIVTSDARFNPLERAFYWIARSQLAVTAASGQLGAAIVKEAIRQLGIQNVIGIARNPEKAAHLV